MGCRVVYHGEARTTWTAGPRPTSGGFPYGCLLRHDDPITWETFSSGLDTVAVSESQLLFCLSTYEGYVNEWHAKITSKYKNCLGEQIHRLIVDR